MNIPVLYEDKLCAIVNKPAGLLTHAVNENDRSESLAGWWLSRTGIQKTGWPYRGREGIVHRLDKDTSGTIVLAKTPEALGNLQEQFQSHNIEKKYTALVFGRPQKDSGRIVSHIARNTKRRTKKVSSLLGLQSDSREAVSNYKLVKTGHVDNIEISTMEFSIETGRTHQIRLHAKVLETPILGDKDYSTKHSRVASDKLGVARQMLHSCFLRIHSPQTGKAVGVEAELPQDMEKIINRYE